MLYDGECPLCMREVNMLRGRDKGVGKIDFVDISSSDYSPEDNANLSYDEVNATDLIFLHELARVGKNDFLSLCCKLANIGYKS